MRKLFILLRVKSSILLKQQINPPTYITGSLPCVLQQFLSQAIINESKRSAALLKN